MKDKTQEIYMSIPEGCNRQSQLSKKVAETSESCGRQLRGWVTAETPEFCRQPLRGLVVSQGGITVKAFTLIELLVVVLIIGILATIAIPQYQVAVEKTKAINLYTLLKSIQKAEQVYFLTAGEYTKDANLLDIDYPAGSQKEGAIITLPNKTQIVFSIEIYAATDYVQLQIPYSDGNGSCWATENRVSQQICASLGKKTNRNSTCSGLGHKSCQMYQLVLN